MSAFYPDATSGLRYHERFAYMVPALRAAPFCDYDHRHAYALLHVSADAQGSTSWPGAVLCAPSQTVFVTVVLHGLLWALALQKRRPRWPPHDPRPP